jgi:hypothetical protein
LIFRAFEGAVVFAILYCRRLPFAKRLSQQRIGDMLLFFCDLKVVFYHKRLFVLFYLHLPRLLVAPFLLGLPLEYPWSIKHQEEKIYLNPLVLLREV